MTIVRFTLLSEGSSEAGLVPHLQRLCVRAGAEEAIGTFPDLSLLTTPPRRDLESRLRALMALGEPPDVLFLHHDADARDDSSARASISAAASAAAAGHPYVPIVPIQELEAWLLVDEDAIRSVAGKPHGRRQLGIPSLGQIERRARPKEILERALITASETAGRRQREFKRRLATYQQALLVRLDIDGPVSQLSSWEKLVDDINRVVGAL